MYATANDGTIIVTADCDGYKINEASKETTPPKGDNTGETSGVTGNANSGMYVVPGAPTSFANCTALREVYPSGVKSTHPAYAFKHDRDQDSWACEN